MPSAFKLPRCFSTVLAGMPIFLARATALSLPSLESKSTIFSLLFCGFSLPISVFSLLFVDFLWRFLCFSLLFNRFLPTLYSHGEKFATSTYEQKRNPQLLLRFPVRVRTYVIDVPIRLHLRGRQMLRCTARKDGLQAALRVISRTPEQSPAKGIPSSCPNHENSRNRNDSGSPCT